MAKKISKEAVLTFLKVTRDALDWYIYHNTPKRLKSHQKPKNVKFKMIEERSKTN